MEAYSRKGLASRSSRHMPMMRLVVVGVLLLEGIIAALVGEYATTSNFYITTVATTDNLTVVGNNPDLNYPVYLGGERCTAAALLECRETDTSICCMELFDPNGSGPEESVTVLQIFAYACVIPFFLLVVRGILLGRVCTKLAEVKYKKGRLPGRPAKGPYPGPYYNPQNGHRHRRSWHKRVGFYSADTILGLLMSVANAYMWTEIVKVLVGRPRPNYQTLHVYSSLAASRKDFTADSILSFPSSHSSVAMSGLAYLAYVLWADIRALVEWRRQAHPRFTLGLALVMGAFMLLLPFSAVAVAITRCAQATPEVLWGVQCSGVVVCYLFFVVEVTHSLPRIALEL
ncbi:unnamed protein product [Discosporangium mesarthrocarpum]